VEQRIVRQHPQLGYDMVQGVPFLRASAEIILTSHEWFDGSGYPKGLKGDQIPLGGRIVALAEAFDAMTARSTYRGKLSAEQAVQEIARCRGTQFDPAVVDAFFQISAR
jgi:HD-GYP domain-containing protein (c-di-GMP phosphodiesterase class II)